MEENKTYNINCIEGLKQLPEKCANLIICDPPYFRVKGDFDFKMTWAEWLQLHEDLARECKRVLSDNGTLFLWGHAKNIAYQQVIFDKLFTLENSIIWRKVDSMQYQYYSPDQARRFNTHNERLLMYSFGYEPGEWEKTGWERVVDEKIKPKHPFAKYLREEFKRAGVTRKEIAGLFLSKSGGLTGCVSNWLNGDNVITKEQYLKIREYLNNEYLRQEYEDLRQEYEDLRQEYEDLRQEYEDLRRPFNNYMKLEEVFEFSQEGHKTKKYDHETVKPEKLTRALILTCSRPGDLVVVPFAGSGTECAMAAKERRRFIGFDTESKYVDMANERARPHLERKQISILDIVGHD